MLPANTWLPAKANDNRFPVVESRLPLPLVAIYRDFATTDPTIDIETMPMNVLAVGPDNIAEGSKGHTPDLSKALKATLTQGNVYGALLIDTMFVPAHSSIDF